MFDDRLAGSLGDPSALLRLASDNLAAERGAGCRKLVLAAAWADCHGAPAAVELADGEPAGQSVLTDRYVRVGPLGTPLVAECCPGELGLAQQTGPVAARNLIGDALSIRHRLPRLWIRVQAGEVWAWKARQVAQRTSHLGPLSARIVDRLVSPHLELMAWQRFEKVLDATLAQVDEAGYHRRAEEAAARRDARVFSDGDGRATLVARLEGGDATAFMALVERVAECLADDGDEDPVAVRRSKAFGIIAHQARLRDLLARHADAGYDPRHPEQRVADHHADPTDPWAADDLPDAGWQTAEHGDYHQPGPHDPSPDDEPSPDEPSPDDEPDQEPVADTDRAWHDQQQDADHDAASQETEPAGAPVPAAFDRRGDDGHCAGCGCGSTFDLRPLTPAELTACRTRVVVHVHVTDHTLIDQHGILRTEHGPITLDQFRRWLTDTDPNLTIRPVLDPAQVAAADSYEIPLAIREAVHTRHPGSVWPYSPAATISTGGRLDLDHTRPYQRHGPPGQTRPGNLAPLTRGEHRAKTVGGWQARQPDPGTHLWRSPHGWIALTTNQGTLLLGDTDWAHQIWQTTPATAAS